MSTHEHVLTPELRAELVSSFRYRARSYELRAQALRELGYPDGATEAEQVAVDYIAEAERLELGL